MKDATLTLVRKSTPDGDGIIEIKSRYGTKRISSTRFAEITLEGEERNLAKGKDPFHPDNIERLLLEEVTHVV